jgi:hypothetical protein
MSDSKDDRALADRFISYLRADLGIPALEFAAPLVRLQGGYETATYRFQCTPSIQAPWSTGSPAKV